MGDVSERSESPDLLCYATKYSLPDHVRSPFFWQSAWSNCPSGSTVVKPLLLMQHFTTAQSPPNDGRAIEGWLHGSNFGRQVQGMHVCMWTHTNAWSEDPLLPLLFIYSPNPPQSTSEATFEQRLLIQPLLKDLRSGSISCPWLSGSYHKGVSCSLWVCPHVSFSLWVPVQPSEQQRTGIKCKLMCIKSKFLWASNAN